MELGPQHDSTPREPRVDALTAAIRLVANIHGTRLDGADASGIEP
jgi:hypothetical protein